MAREIRDDQRYRDKLLKLIPSEIVAVYMTISGFFAGGIVVGESDITKIVAWAVFAFLLFLTPVYLMKFNGVRRAGQLLFTTVSFVVWVYSLGGPFQLHGWHQPQLASILLVLWTLLIPLGITQKQPATTNPTTD